MIPLEEATKTPQRFSLIFEALSVYLTSLFFGIQLWATAAQHPSSTSPKLINKQLVYRSLYSKKIFSF
jgi:hypothetical protein